MLKKIYASEMGAKLDSNVHCGGGHDDTEILQSILDRAKAGEGVYLILDGAAKVRGLQVYSNTTIECPNGACGLYLQDNSNAPLLCNANPVMQGAAQDKNITLIGGTYNHNCRAQAHHIHKAHTEESVLQSMGQPEYDELVVALRFCGVENLLIRDICLQDQRTFAGTFINWRHVTIENVQIALPNKEHYQNQDGFHFFGPGQFLHVKNVSGDSGDDFLALAPDEIDGVSTITDVLIEDIVLDNADQGIRMLCHDRGTLDRVHVRNISGTYRSFGFFICPFFCSAGKGHYGRITIENVDLRPVFADYTYTPNFLFRLGGQFDSVTLQNIHFTHAVDARNLLQIGYQYYSDDVPVPPQAQTYIRNLRMSNIQIDERKPLECGNRDLITVQQVHIHGWSISDLTCYLPQGQMDRLLYCKEGTRIDVLRFVNGYAENLDYIGNVPQYAKAFSADAFYCNDAEGMDV